MAELGDDGVVCVGNFGEGLLVYKDRQVSNELKTQICGYPDPHKKITSLKSFKILG